MEGQEKSNYHTGQIKSFQGPNLALEASCLTPLENYKGKEGNGVKGKLFQVHLHQLSYSKEIEPRHA